ncbi:MAG: hypothetical protein ACWIPJ_11445 [Polaribacter sp.]
MFFSCEKEELDSPSNNKDNENIKNSKDKVKDAISFLNTNFVSQPNLRAQARGLGQKGNLEEYSKNKIKSIHELNDEDGTHLLKLICFEPSGYALISNLENVPNPPVLFYSQNKFDKNNVNPSLIKYVQEFILTHTKNSNAPPEDDDKNGDGSWDDGRDTGGSGDPRDSPYYHEETVLNTWQKL